MILKALSHMNLREIFMCVNEEPQEPEKKATVTPTAPECSPICPFASGSAASADRSGIRPPAVDISVEPLVATPTPAISPSPAVAVGSAPATAPAAHEESCILKIFHLILRSYNV